MSSDQTVPPAPQLRPGPISGQPAALEIAIDDLKIKAVIGRFGWLVIRTGRTGECAGCASPPDGADGRRNLAWKRPSEVNLMLDISDAGKNGALKLP